MNKKRKLLWTHPFQTRLVLRIVTYAAGFQAINWLVFMALEATNHISVTALGVETTLSTALLRGAFALLILGPAVTFDAIQFSHRLVGPLVRFRQNMQSIAAGEPVAPLKLRKGDFLVDLQDDFNAMLKSLEQQGYVVVKRPGTADANAVTPARACSASAPA